MKTPAHFALALSALLTTASYAQISPDAPLTHRIPQQEYSAPQAFPVSPFPVAPISPAPATPVTPIAPPAVTAPDLPSVETIQAQQQARIHWGVRAGLISPREWHVLQSQQRQLEFQRYHAYADGWFTADEQHQLYSTVSQLSARIEAALRDTHLAPAHLVQFAPPPLTAWSTAWWRLPAGHGGHHHGAAHHRTHPAPHLTPQPSRPVATPVAAPAPPPVAVRPQPVRGGHHREPHPR